jgi:hypothetical protein
MDPIDQNEIDSRKVDLDLKKKSKGITKLLLFDLDETLGSFSDLYILWKTLEKYIYIDNKLLFFHKLFDLYPEFLRHGILNILEFLYYKKQTGECSKIYIYTNNQCNNILHESAITSEQYAHMHRVCCWKWENLHVNAGRRIPHAFACRQIGVHVLLSPRLDDFHPLHPGKKRKRRK